MSKFSVTKAPSCRRATLISLSLTSWPV